MRPEPVRIGLVGLGDIAGRYADTLQAAPGVTVVAGASPSPERALARRSLALPIITVEALLGRPDVDLVVNLTPPTAHADITRRALAAGRAVYSEKPLATTLDEARDLIAAAEASARVLACAPATPLGPAQQTARRLIDAGQLGTVWGAAATLVYPGPDLWHHDADRLFARGAGVVMDMGVYDVTALVHLLGPVGTVTAGGGRVRTERAILAGPRAGQRFPVEALTHAVALLSFVSGATATVTLGFDAPGARRTGLEIYGSEATLALPRSGDFAGEMTTTRAFGQWEPVSPAFGWSDAAWCIGVLDTADALRTGRSPRASSDMALHVLEVLLAIERSVAEGMTIEIASRPTRPEPLSAAQFAGLVTLPALELAP